jgi:uncharacterized protein involved in tolerance to divalent cations
MGKLPMDYRWKGKITEAEELDCVGGSKFNDAFSVSTRWPRRD